MSTKRDFVRAGYTSDDGNIYTVKIGKELADDTHNGFLTFDDTKPPLPQGYKMRYALAVGTSGNRRKVAIGTTTCDLSTGTTKTVSMSVIGSADPEVFTIWHFQGESRGVPHQVVNI